MNLTGFVVVHRQLKPARGKMRVIKLRLSFSRDKLPALNLAVLDTSLPWTDWVEMDSIPSVSKLLDVIEVTDQPEEKIFGKSQDLNMAWQSVREQFLNIVDVQSEKAQAS